MGKSPMNVVVLLGDSEGQAGMAGTDRAPVLLLPDRRFVTDGESSALRDTRYPPFWRVRSACLGPSQAEPNWVIGALWFVSHQHLG